MRDAGDDGGITEAVRALGGGPLTESALREHAWPLFSRVRRETEGLIYLANHSLGRPLDRTSQDIQLAVDRWYTELGDAWGAWMDLQFAYRAQMARLIGCSRPDAIVPKTSVAQGLRAVINALPTARPRILSTRGEFDSVDHVLKTYHHKGRAEVTFVEGNADGAFDGKEIAGRIDGGIDLVVVSMTMFVTGQVLPHLDRVIARARDVGAPIVLDSYHAAGVMPISFDDLDADFMMGGNYKYTRGGPGACWLAINPRHLGEGGTPACDSMFTLDTGWFAKREPFAYDRSVAVDLAAGGDAWMEATPPILTYAQAMAGLELTNAIGLDRLRAYSLEQQHRLEGLLSETGVETTRVAIEGQDPPRHGAYVLIPTTDAKALLSAMEDHKIIADGRPCPTTGRWYVRLCPDLLTADGELERTAQVLAELAAAV
ncbi:MAG: aminotransferase class V-fold PLP-dependent enzyme [Planctomycetota bacterium]